MSDGGNNEDAPIENSNVEAESKQNEDVTNEIKESTEKSKETQEPAQSQPPAKQTNNKGAPSGDIPADLNPESAWKAISANHPSINWYLLGLNKKMDVVFKQAGQKGLEELITVLKGSAGNLLFGLLRVNSNDKGGSKRAKFLFIRFVGSTVGTMQKAKLTPKLGKISESFPVKHLTYDLSEDLTDFSIETISREMLRVGGAHKPDSFDFGPNQAFICQ